MEIQGRRCNVNVSQNSIFGRCLTATQTIEAGQTIFQELPYDSVAYYQYSHVVCADSYKPEKSLKRCQRCAFCYFSGRQAQERAWKNGHQEECLAVASVPSKARVGETTRLAARIIWKIYKNGGGQEDDYIRNLVHHWDSIPEKSKTIFQQEAGKVISLAMAGQPALRAEPPSWLSVQNTSILLAKICCNAQAIEDNECNSVGLGLYQYCSLLNHNNMPTCIQSYDGKLCHVRALRDIKQGEVLSISYTDATQVRRQQRVALLAQFQFDIDLPVSVEPNSVHEIKVLAGQNTILQLDQGLGSPRYALYSAGCPIQRHKDERYNNIIKQVASVNEQLLSQISPANSDPKCVLQDNEDCTQKPVPTYSEVVKVIYLQDSMDQDQTGQGCPEDPHIQAQWKDEYTEGICYVTVYNSEKELWYTNKLDALKTKIRYTSEDQTSKTIFGHIIERNPVPGEPAHFSHISDSYTERHVWHVEIWGEKSSSEPDQKSVLQTDKQQNGLNLQQNQSRINNLIDHQQINTVERHAGGINTLVAVGKALSQLAVRQHRLSQKIQHGDVQLEPFLRQVKEMLLSGGMSDLVGPQGGTGQFQLGKYHHMRRDMLLMLVEAYTRLHEWKAMCFHCHKLIEIEEKINEWYGVCRVQYLCKHAKVCDYLGMLDLAVAQAKQAHQALQRITHQNDDRITQMEVVIEGGPHGYKFK